MDSIRFKKDIVNSYEAFKELEKVRLNAVPKKKEWILNQSNLLPDMQNTLRYNINAYEDDFWKNHNQYFWKPVEAARSTERRRPRRVASIQCGHDGQATPAALKHNRRRRPDSQRRRDDTRVLLPPHARNCSIAASRVRVALE
jgi:hypothetical protein